MRSQTLALRYPASGPSAPASPNKGIGRKFPSLHAVPRSATRSTAVAGVRGGSFSPLA